MRNVKQSFGILVDAPNLILFEDGIEDRGFGGLKLLDFFQDWW